MANYTFRSYLDVVMRTLEGNAENACKVVATIAQEAIQNKILYGYQIPHGKDGHTEIVDTGRLFDSITAEVEKVSENTWEVAAGASSEAGRMEDVSYARYVHEGTEKLVGRPFVRDALMDEETQEKITNAFVDELKKGS